MENTLTLDGMKKIWSVMQDERGKNPHAYRSYLATWCPTNYDVWTSLTRASRYWGTDISDPNNPNHGRQINVFEIGCGSGGILSSFAKKGKRVSGCDYGEKYLKFGQDQGLDLYSGEIDTKKTSKNSQDLIIISHVLEHVTNPINFINEILEYLKDEKYLLVEVPGIFDIKKTYYNPSLYFQNAHIFNFYKYYLNQFFKIIGLKIIYSDERCTLILQKPKNWKISDISNIYDHNMPIWANKIEVELKKLQLYHILKINPYYLRASLVSVLEKLGLKQGLKNCINK